MQWTQKKYKQYNSGLYLRTNINKKLSGSMYILASLRSNVRHNHDAVDTTIRGVGSFTWDSNYQKTFDVLKGHLTTAPVLSYCLPNGRSILDTDAGNVGIEGILSQLQNNSEKVIRYFSKVLSKAERNYCINRRELLAVIRSVEHFYSYLHGRKLLLKTDYKTLKWLLISGRSS